MKTKLGISVALFGAGICALAAVGNYTSVLLAAGYIFLAEDSNWLKKTALKALATLLFFGFLLTLVGILPEVTGCFDSFFSLLDVDFRFRAFSSFMSIITQAIEIFRTCLLLALAVKALDESTISVPVVDDLLNKHFAE